MLELTDVCFSVTKNGEEVNLVDHVSFKVPGGHFMAIVGPSGCGKTTLLKTIAGLTPESEGTLFWKERNLAEEDFSPLEIGYVPQFSIAYESLTVDEAVEAATRLRVRTHSLQQLDQRIDRVLHNVGLSEIRDRQIKVLSGGQKRRLGLAMELVSDPKVLLCDEVTSGLDPRSEREIVSLLHDLSYHDDRIVLSVTHSLAHLELYDSILVLYEGVVAFHGPPAKLSHYFSVHDTEEVYPRLAARSASSWQSSWLKHGPAYQTMLATAREHRLSHARAAESAPSVETKSNLKDPADPNSPKIETAALEETPLSFPLNDEPPVLLPGFVAQFLILISRRWRIFFRDRGQVLLQIGIMILFPVLVTLFSDRASGNIRRYSDMRQTDVFAEIQEQQSVRADQAKVGSAVSGIIMFQVVLLALMGSNNSAREIAGERHIYEKEKFGGLRPSAYLASKLAFLSVLVFVQALWMAFYVHYFGPFRGNFVQHALFLLLVNGAMTSICLAISSWMRTAEQASLMSIYLVGFQLPLSGAVLALNEKVEVFTRPFISAYWAWSGSVGALQTQVHEAVRSVIDTSFSPAMVCAYALMAHILVSILVAWTGTRRPQWQ